MQCRKDVVAVRIASMSPFTCWRVAKDIPFVLSHLYQVSGKLPMRPSRAFNIVLDSPLNSLDAALKRMGRVGAELLCWIPSPVPVQQEWPHCGWAALMLDLRLTHIRLQNRGADCRMHMLKVVCTLEHQLPT